jgi:SAM-dependent methyltransferase
LNLDAYRNSAAEQERIADLMRLVPRVRSVLDVGARDGYLSRRLAERIDSVISLDLTLPEGQRPNIRCMAGDIRRLDVPDNFVECVLCAEVLEHIPGDGLAQACAEISRIAADAIVIGVPYRQDLRLGRTVCAACGAANPPWGHVQSFAKSDLIALFPGWHAAECSFVGRTRETTNALSALLMDFAGNPYGTYQQEECCIYCRSAIGEPAPRKLLQKIATRAAWTLTRMQQRFAADRPKWLHVLFTRR